MRPEYYQRLWQDLKSSPEQSALTHLADRIAHSFIDHYFYSDNYESEYLTLLCEMAVHFDDNNGGSDLNGAATGALFGIIIERLCDDFEELQTETYNRVMSKIVSIILAHPAGQPLRERLLTLGLTEQEPLYNRIESIRSNSDRRRKPKRTPQKVIILSRVTIGADVAVSSVLCQRLHQQFPQAEVVLVGPQKLTQLYAENPYVRIAPLNYTRRGDLIGRFNAWLALSDIIGAEKGNLADDELLVFDPDSRLTQLGILPLVNSDSYYFFNSRGKDSYPKKIPIAELSNFWLDAVLGPNTFCYPRVWPANAHLGVAEKVAATLRGQGIQKIISMNFGVGGNARKQLPFEFEEQLVLTLLEEKNTAIFLDLGFGDEETQRNQAILEAVERRGIATVACDYSSLSEQAHCGGVIGVRCDIGEIASLIACSDEFIGYDSACQHMAAALNKPTYTVFAGTSNVRFIRRWTACGPNVSEIIFVDNESKAVEIDCPDIVERIIDRRYAIT